MAVVAMWGTAGGQCDLDRATGRAGGGAYTAGVLALCTNSTHGRSEHSGTLTKQVEPSVAWAVGAWRGAGVTTTAAERRAVAVTAPDAWFSWTLKMASH